jgi:hypothetical protein
MLGTTHQMAQCHIPEVLIPQQHRCENLKSGDDNELESTNTVSDTLDQQKDTVNINCKEIAANGLLVSPTSMFNTLGSISSPTVEHVLNLGHQADKEKTDNEE